MSDFDVSERRIMQPSSPRWLQHVLAILLGALILAALGLAATLAIAHACDLFWVNIASGSWLALAWHADHGQLYPPLRDAEGAFAGTRYMPLHVLSHAGLSRITGEYLLSGRIIGFTSAALWTLGIAALARQRGAARLFAGALAASVLASPTGVQALCTIRSDGLALALQLWALWIVGRSKRPASVVLAAILCALAFMTKLTALWAALAIALWLLWRDRRAFLAFSATLAVLAGGALLAINLATDGRFADNMTHASASGWRGWGSVVLWSPRRILQFVSEWSPTTWPLVPAAALALLLAASRRELAVVHLAWLACGAAMVVMYADAGVGENHIIELAAITAVVAGDLWRRAGSAAPIPQAIVAESLSASPRPLSDDRCWSIAQLLLAVIVGWSSQAVIKQRLWPDIAGAIAQLRSGAPAPEDDPHALDDLLRGRRFLSDDPRLAVLLDQKPAISDAFIFRGLEASRPEWIEEVVDRIARHEFEVIVLTREADPDSWWYRELFLGPRVVRAIAEAYRLDRTAAGRFVYRPND